MFKINIYLRFALIAVGLLGGIALSAAWGFWYGFPFILGGVILLIGYILLGTVQSAAEIMQAGDFLGAEQRLNLTLTPKLLYSLNRAYYYMIKGSIAVQDKRVDEGEEFLKMASAIEVPTANEKAMLELQLANIAAMKNRWKQAQIHFRNAKQQKVTEPAIKEQLREFEKAFASRGQMKAAARMGKGGGAALRQGSGKRRRPKMR